MKALVYTGPGTVEVLDRPKPTIQAPTDAVVRVLHASICGTDLHILKGDVPKIQPGIILGHEGVGVIDAVGSAVDCFQIGDRVLISCMTSCGVCRLCQRGITSHCTTGGWTLGNWTNGTQAEFVRVPHAKLSLHPLPPSMNPRDAVTMSDAFPTGLECGVLSANVQPGGSVVIVGAGPVGMATLLTARLYSPALIVAVDLDEARLATAWKLGAHVTIRSSDPNALQQLLDQTQGEGYDSVIEAVGIPATFALSQKLVAVGGRIANVGVHGTKVDLHLETLWDRNISVHMSPVNATTTPRLLRLAESGLLDLSSLVTHRFHYTEGPRAYATFQKATQHQALKVAIDFDPA
ncbi:alcohol dehydrogenase [Aspergillus sclerotialis]|uniref:Alcohol dehydrogenase n=1 Tax=Aspergillus sclerotialis TaxID=2070753 RepID=A0A3A2ZW09_9EURO|nr:alcohol dehydrogenase [Aspergillus sclerotialis]